MCFVVLNLYYTGCLLRICSVVRFLGEGLLCNRSFASKLFFKRYIAVVIGRSPWRRPGIVFDNKASLVGQVFRFGIGSLLCRFSAKKRPISFVLYPQINPTARFDGGQKRCPPFVQNLFYSRLVSTAYRAHKLHLSLQRQHFARIRTCFERRYY